jgi:hypothetical protein
MDRKRPFIGLLLSLAIFGASHAMASGAAGGGSLCGEHGALRGAPIARLCGLLSCSASLVTAAPLLLAEMQETKDIVLYSTSSPEDDQNGFMFRSPQAEEQWKQEKAWEMLDSMHLGVFPGSSRGSSSGSAGADDAGRGRSYGR